jgi:hypothetical protein
MHQKKILDHKKMSSKRRGKTYTPQEQQCLLNIVRRIRAIVQDEWEAVTTEHLQTWPDCGRDYLSIRRKFNQLANRPNPTGDPHCPEEVREAKEILQLIKDRADIENFSDEEEKVVAGVPSEGDNRLSPPTVATNATANAAESGSSVNVGATGTVASVVSPRLQRVSHSRKRKNVDEFSLQDFFKMQMMERQERREEEREKRRRREAQDNFFQNMMLAAMMNMNPNMSHNVSTMSKAPEDQENDSSDD